MMSACSTSVTHRSLHDFGSPFPRLVLPKPERHPAQCPQMVVSLTVPLHVLTQLRQPPLAVRRRETGVFGTHVPEATIDEHGDPRGAKQQISTTPRHARKESIHPVPKATPVKLAS